MLHLLLANRAEKAKYIIENFKPEFESKELFLAKIDEIENSGDRIQYDNDVANVRL
jgi:hypothetical protein